MEIYIIELPKFDRYKEKTDKKLNLWVKIIENPEVVDMKENKEVVKAKNMRKQNIDIETICKVTGLTIEEIKNIKD